MTESTNRVLFAIVIMLFAIVLKLVSNGMDIVVFLIALAGLLIGWWGVVPPAQRRSASLSESARREE